VGLESTASKRKIGTEGESKEDSDQLPRGFLFEILKEDSLFSVESTLREERRKLTFFRSCDVLVSFVEIARSPPLQKLTSSPLSDRVYENGDMWAAGGGHSITIGLRILRDPGNLCLRTPEPIELLESDSKLIEPL
jgi:hypothetical protein